MPRFQDLSGQRFGRWTVVNQGPDYRRGIPAWNCQCDCGKTGTIRAGTLKSGGSRSCGCLNVDVHREMCIKRNTKHGMTRTPTYLSWGHMIRRCHDPKHRQFPDYGGRGISVCSAWRESFAAFLADVGPCPPGLTIERINNDRGYEPGNCKWATRKAQALNRRSNHRLTLNGVTAAITEWAERLGISRKTIENRLKLGLPIDKVLSPVRHGRSWRPLASPPPG